jgi:thiol-disulfide isomerase/thioredoxin
MCGHCRDIAPLYNEMSKKNPHIAFAHVETSKVDVENLNGVPVFVGYVSGIPDDKYIVLGASERELNRMIRSM